MGSFAGHIDEAIFFLLIATWWMIQSFPRHIRSVLTRKTFQSKLSYPFIPSSCCKRRPIPVEQVLKTLFPLCGLAAELWSRGPSFIDADGHFRKLEEVQHVSIYALFTVHGVIDLLSVYSLPLPRGLDYLSGAIAFGWYGYSFSLHANMPGKGDLERMVHRLPVPIMLATAACMLLELKHRASFLLHATRIFCVMVLGTYFTHVSFVLFRHDVFPGWQQNPAWDQNDHRNVHFMVAALGFHLCLNVVLLTVFYVIIYGVLRVLNPTLAWKAGYHENALDEEGKDAYGMQDRNGRCYNNDDEGEEYNVLIES